MRLTRRGKIVVGLAVFLALAGFTYLTRDLCWVGDGYGSCRELLSRYGN
jgi:hypothetical protein